MNNSGNQWAILEKYNVDTLDHYAERTMDGTLHREVLGAYVHFTGVAPATPQILKAIQKWMYKDNAKFPIYQEEWMCLWCGSPNELPETHCTHCGAPRNWLIG